MSMKPRPCGCPPEGPVIMRNHMEITVCLKIEPPHPCDPIQPCDPCNEDEGKCTPALCLEKLRNPAWPGELTTCRSGQFLKVEQCKRPDPPHPCDDKICIPGLRKKLKCPPAALCRHRIKNPMKKTPIICPNDSYEAFEPKQPACDPDKHNRRRVICDE